VFAVLGDLGSVDLGDHPSGGLYEKIFNKILRTSDVLINGFGGSFILYGLTRVLQAIHRAVITSEAVGSFR
jgi:hypothetical protein